MRLAALALASFAIACAEPQPAGPSADDVRAAIEASNHAFGEAVRAGDTAAIAALYTEDGAVLPPNGAKASGRPALAEFWAGALSSGVAGAVLTTEEVVYTGGDTASEVGSAVLTTKDGSVADEGKYVVLWKQSESAWRMHRDIWNSNRPPVAAPAPPPTAAGEAAAEPTATPEP